MIRIEITASVPRSAHQVQAATEAMGALAAAATQAGLVLHSLTIEEDDA